MDIAMVEQIVQLIINNGTPVVLVAFIIIALTKGVPALSKWFKEKIDNWLEDQRLKDKEIIESVKEIASTNKQLTENFIIQNERLGVIEDDIKEIKQTLKES